MKHIPLTIIAALVAFTIQAADNAKESAKWIDSISVAPVGVIKTAHLDGPSQWGAGLDLGVGINPFVSLHVINLSFEGDAEAKAQGTKPKVQGKKGTGGTSAGGEDSWGGLLVDETDLQIDAKISRFSNESFSLHLVSGGQYDWNSKDYGINAGLRVELAFNKTVSVSAGYSIRTWFKGETRVDSLASAQVSISF